MTTYVTPWEYVDDTEPEDEWTEAERNAIEKNVVVLLDMHAGSGRTAGYTNEDPDRPLFIIHVALVDLDGDAGVKDGQALIVGTVVDVERDRLKQAWAFVEVP